MPVAITVNTVMRALADPNQRAVFEPIAKSDELTVVWLTLGSGDQKSRRNQ